MRATTARARHQSAALAVIAKQPANGYGIYVSRTEVDTQLAAAIALLRDARDAIAPATVAWPTGRLRRGQQRREAASLNPYAQRVGVR